MRLLITGMVLILCMNGIGQTLKKYPIGNSGCSLYAYCDAKYKVDYSDDSSAVYTGECTVAGVTYGVICVKLLHPIDNIDVAEELMISYVDYLKGNFEITKSTGYGKGHRLNEDEQTRGILDYWEDKEMDKWKIKSWTNGKFIGFMYAYSSKELPVTKVDVFLEGLRFPGMK